MLTKWMFARAHASAEKISSNVLARADISANAPADLRDEMPHFLASGDGTRPGTLLVASDVGIGRTSPLAALCVLFPVAVLVSAAFTGALIFLLAIYGVVVYMYYTAYISRKVAVLQSLIYAGDGEFARAIAREVKTRHEQCERAALDKSDFFELGKSTSQVGGFLGADRGRGVGLTLNDLSTHLFVFGATGTGKTSGALRPLAQWYAQRRGGMLVMDGKGDLPREFDGVLPGFKLLVPGRDAVDLLAGLEPHDVVAALSAAANVGDSDESFWSRSASDLLYNASVVCFAAAETRALNLSFALSNIAKILENGKFRAEVCLSLAKNLDKGDITLQRALTQFASGWDPDKNNTQAGVLATALSLVTGLLRHPALCNWASPEADANLISVADVLKGKRYGLDVPEYRYGAAAGAVTNLLRAQVYKAAQLRGSKSWNSDATHCLILIDEAAISLGTLEQQMLPVARSLGLSFACATQNIEQFEARFGNFGARALVDQFRSQVCLNASAATLEYVQNRAGSGVRESKAQAQVVGLIRSRDLDATSLDPRTHFSREQSLRATGLRQIALGLNPQEIEKEGLKIEVGPIFSKDEQISLAKGEALCVLNRANAPRVETVLLNAQYNTQANNTPK